MIAAAYHEQPREVPCVEQTDPSYGRHIHSVPAPRVARHIIGAAAPVGFPPGDIAVVKPHFRVAQRDEEPHARGCPAGGNNVTLPVEAHPGTALRVPHSSLHHDPGARTSRAHRDVRVGYGMI